MPSTITLITDFGLEDGHVGAMKGVIRSMAPDATVIDVSHSLESLKPLLGRVMISTGLVTPPPRGGSVIDDKGA